MTAPLSTMPPAGVADAASRVRRAAHVVLILFGLATWNLIFHWHHVADSRDYLYRQARFQQGRGPDVGVRQTMAESARVGVIDATAWSVGLTGAGVAIVEVVFRREVRKARARANTGRLDA